MVKQFVRADPSSQPWFSDTGRDGQAETVAQPEDDRKHRTKCGGGGRGPTTGNGKQTMMEKQWETSDVANNLVAGYDNCSIVEQNILMHVP